MGDVHEIESPEALRELLASGAPLSGGRWQDLDLSDLHAELLARTDLKGVAVLGGHYAEDLGDHLRRCGAWVFPAPADLPVRPYRSRLYTPDDLYDTMDRGYAACTDARGYAWSRDEAAAGDPLVTALQAIHDDAMSDALAEQLTGRPVVGVMGGHALQRGSQVYRAAAQVGHRLAAAGNVVITGGGPGAMEAANLGAACHDAGQVDLVVDELASEPGWDAGVDAWARAALTTRERHGLVPTAGTPARSIGVPTWFYGHEPPNVFAHLHAKFFSNALREDILLASADRAVVVLPGAAGTVQEIFQLATRLYYPAGRDPRLVLVGKQCWTEDLPVLPVLRALGRGRPMTDAVHLVNDIEHAVSIVLAAPDAAVQH